MNITILSFFEAVMGYIPLGSQCTRLVLLVSFANAALPYVLTAYPAP